MRVAGNAGQVSGDSSHDSTAEPAVDRKTALSAYHRLVLSCLADSGGERRIVQLARDVTRRVEGTGPGCNSNFEGSTLNTAVIQETYLTVHSLVRELTDEGYVTYSDDSGLVKLT